MDRQRLGRLHSLYLFRPLGHEMDDKCSHSIALPFYFPFVLGWFGGFLYLLYTPRPPLGERI